MASKANMLKSGVKRTGRGLFSGMSPMSTTVEDTQEKEIKEKIVKEPSVTNEEVEKEESVSLKQAEIAANDEVVKTEENAEIIKEVKKAPEPANKSPEISEAIEKSIIPTKDNVENVRADEAHVSETTGETISAELTQPAPLEEKEDVTEKEVEQVSTVNVMEEQTVASRQEHVEEKETTAKYNETAPTYDRNEKVEKKQSEKQSSRYEKEKFLLLDIRGYRDYVEHMSKAFNMSATKYIRMLIENDMKLNEDIYREHKAFEEKLRERSLK